MKRAAERPFCFLPGNALFSFGERLIPARLMALKGGQLGALLGGQPVEQSTGLSASDRLRLDTSENAPTGPSSRVGDVVYGFS
jgi:hypothetical protein